MKFSTLLLLSTFTGSNAFYNSHDIITHDDGSVHLFEKTQHRRLTTKNLKVNSDATNTKFTVHGSEYITMNLHVDGYTTLGGLEFEDAGDTFGNKFLTALAGPGITVASGKLTADTDTNTQLSDAQVRAKFSAGTGMQISGTGVISTTVVDTTIPNTDTQLSDAQVRSKFSAGTGITISGAGEIATTVTDTNTQLSDAEVRAKFSAGTGITLSGTGEIATTVTDTNTQLTAAEVRAKFSAGTGMQISGAGVISTTVVDTNTDTNTQLSDAQVRSKFSAGTGMQISGAGVISTTVVDTTIADTNTQLSDAQVRSKFSAGTGITISGTGEIASGLTAAANSGLTISGAAISANVATGVIKDALDAIEAADTTTAVQKEYRLEKMVLVLCNTLGIKYEHLVRAVDEGTFDPYERFSAIQVNDDALYATDSMYKFVDVTAVSTALCSTYTNYDSACPSGYSNKHALARCASGTCAPSDYTASGLCCLPN